MIDLKEAFEYKFCIWNHDDSKCKIYIQKLL